MHAAKTHARALTAFGAGAGPNVVRRPSKRSRGVARAEEHGSPQSSTELWELHERLVKDIEERKSHQATLLDRLKRLGSNGTSPVSTKAPPQPPVVDLPPPPPPPPQQQQQRKIPEDPHLAREVVERTSASAIHTAPKAPLAGENVMNVVVVGIECAPWSKTGGLGDVMGALPKALARRGHRVMVVAPRYAVYEEAWETGVRRRFRVMGQEHEVGYFHANIDGTDFVFVDHSCFHGRGGDIYGGGREALLFRCALLSKAALEAVWHVPCNGNIYGEDNLVFVANDWHTALLPVYLQAHYRDHNQMAFARCIMVIHNMAHQGRGPFPEVDNFELNDFYKQQFWLDDPVGGVHMNILKAGLQSAHRLVAVSRGYAWECQTQEGGWGLDMVLRENPWKLSGIVNGIDYNEWSPKNDSFLRSDGYTNYDIDTLQQGKAQCKAALQRELGLPVEPSVPLLGFIGRLDYQKGVDLIRDSYDWLISEGCQLIMLGSGREDLEGSLREMECRNSRQCRAWVGFSGKVAHRITAGCDLLLMPSRFEPCGLNQLYAMAYGSVPVVHAVGGLRDTVTSFNPHENSGMGWTFERADAQQMRDAIYNALNTYRRHRDSFEGIQRRGMAQDLSWDHAAQQYEEILVQAKYQW